MYFHNLLTGSALNPLEPYAKIEFPGTHPMLVYDHTTNYFGDYFHVTLEVTHEIPLADHAGKPRVADAASPAVVSYSRLLQRMAVPSAQLEDVRQSLLEEFKRHTLPYLLKPGFSARLAACQNTRGCGKTRHYSERAE